jgi:hypothetical protein
MASAPGTASSKIDEGVEPAEFEPVYEMPTGRLQDHLENLEYKQMSVLNMDACLPKGVMTLAILRTFLEKLSEKRTVETLSMKYNHFGGELGEFLVNWIVEDDTVKVLYLSMATGIDAKLRDRIQEAWEKHYTIHTYENNNFSFFRR